MVTPLSPKKSNTRTYEQPPSRPLSVLLFVILSHHGRINPLSKNQSSPKKTLLPLLSFSAFGHHETVKLRSATSKDGKPWYIDSHRSEYASHHLIATLFLPLLCLICSVKHEIHSLFTVFCYTSFLNQFSHHHLLLLFFMITRNWISPTSWASNYYHNFAKIIWCYYLFMLLWCPISILIIHGIIHIIDLFMVNWSRYIFTCLALP